MSRFQSYAARFAAKEAMYKAISPDSANEVSWHDVEVKNMENGKPVIILHGRLQEIANAKGLEKEDIELSLSHDDSYAIATVVVAY